MVLFLHRPISRIKTACIVSKGNNEEIDRIGIKMAEIFKRNKIEPCLLKPLVSSDYESLDSFASISKAKIDLVVVVGGDGTILKTIRNIVDNVPVLGINMGGRGLLAEVTPQDGEKAVESIAKGKYILDKRMRLVAKVGRKILPPALNEIYIDRLTKLRAPTYKISVDDEPPISHRMDGVMVSTPTGSTGHALSFGSSVIHEKMETMLLTPIAPILRMPSIILPPSKVAIESTDNSSVLIDGQLDFPFRAKNEIVISKYDNYALFIRFASLPLRQLKRLGY
ncbi:MAG: NAD(+)/NADH kinase [Thaumarchaeota archaeon]|nr:NAD(+)/NADH kinase [Nitrososphaerota archaeon]